MSNSNGHTAGGLLSPDTKWATPTVDEWEEQRELAIRPSSPEPDPIHKRRVTVTEDEHIVIDEVEEALAADPSLYHRDGQLVRVQRITEAGDSLRPPGTPIITPAPLAFIRTCITRCVDLERTNKAGVSRAHPAPWLTPGIAARSDWPHVRHLTAVSDAPVLRPDGSIHQTTGYDSRTGVLFEPSARFSAIPDRITQADASDAAGRLLKVIEDFRCETIHRSAWLAGLLTPIARFAFRGCNPLFLVDANVRGAGKTLMAQIWGAILTGRALPTDKYSHDPVELAKTFTSLLMEGALFILLDNIEGSFGNPTLDKALTCETWRDRVMSTNKMVTLPMLATLYATGNNVSIAGDTARRIIHIRLEVMEERPEERRDFHHRDLLAWVGSKRAALFADAMLILAGFIRAGKPDQQLTPFGSFEGWSDLVRSAIVWAGLEDPCKTREGLAETSDSTTDALRGLLDAWGEYDALGTGIIISEMLGRLYPAESRYSPADPASVAMRAAIESLTNAAPGKPPSTRTVGNRLKSFQRRIVDGRYLDIAGRKSAGVSWMRYQAKNET